jgi:anti-sigma factor RsiW
MQEALDGSLDTESLAELRQNLDANAGDSGQFQRLKQIDRTLRSAPHERAPQRMAAAIMSQLSEAVSTRQMPRVSGLALALGLALAAAAILPALLAAGWLLLASLGSAALLASAFQQVAGLLALGLMLAEQAVTSVQALLAANTEAALLLVAAVPLSLLWLLRLGPRLRAQRTL